MKKLLLPLLALLFLISCEKENNTELLPELEFQENESVITRNSNKRDVCHNGNIININVFAITAHQAHGDAVDMDGDGYFDLASSCGTEVDCDDNDSSIFPGATEIICNGIDDDCNSETPDVLEEICDNGIDDDCDGYVDGDDSDCSTNCVGHEINFNGPLFVALADEPGFYNWQGAKDACALKALAEECGWYLPSKEELNALYNSKNAIGGFDEATFWQSYYWSSTYYDAYGIWTQSFYNGTLGYGGKNQNYRCRCVKR